MRCDSPATRPTDEHMRAAAEYVRGAGGLQRARVFTHIWMALFGAWPWSQVPALPPELILLPAWFPLNVYDFACWARQTVVALSVVLSQRPVRPLPFTLDELDGPEPWSPPSVSSRFGRGLVALDRVMRLYERRPLAPLRRLALSRAERWIVDRQEADGGWGGIQPPWVYSLIALHLLGYPLEHPVMERGLDGMQNFTIEEEPRRVEACQSPVWDTCLSLIALHDAGVPGDHEAVIRGADWLIDQQILQRGDWAVRQTEARARWLGVRVRQRQLPRHRRHGRGRPGARDRRPSRPRARARGDRPRRPLARRHAQLRRRLGRVRRRQLQGAGARPPVLRLRRGDRPAERRRHRPRRRDARRAGSRRRRADVGAASAGCSTTRSRTAPGSGAGASTTSTAPARSLPALVAAGVPAADPAIRRAVRWLERHQNADGGWGEDCRSYDDPAWIGRGESTPSQTAWALLALEAAGEPDSAAARGGVQWLLENQREDGDWDEDHHTGTGFPSDFYIKYHLYRLIFPIMALGRCMR